MYKVFGYDDMCIDFEYTGLTFTRACKLYMSIDAEGMNVVFISGVSQAVEDKLRDAFYRRITSHV